MRTHLRKGDVQNPARTAPMKNHMISAGVVVLRKLPILAALATMFFFASVAAAQYRIVYVDSATVLEEDSAHHEQTWYWPSFWETTNRDLHFLAHGGNQYPGSQDFTSEGYRCGFQEPG